MRLTGIVAAIGGIAIMLIAFLSVPAAPDEIEILRHKIEEQSRRLDPSRLPAERSHPALAANAAAWQQNRTLAFYGGAALFLAGVILFAAGSVTVGRRPADD